ncbi:DNA methyltransferase [Bradyrhizobium sp. 27S5]|uniref:DNA methyltransferase n=1 Tax=Bradyrhizobium sp. 27S5 TaxID=3139728 RepID=UPI0030D16ADE
MSSALAYNKEFAFNAICPYYTMFPLEYPMKIIRKHREDDPVIVDPFCGRGTTLYAARRLGFTSFGFDTSPIAAAIAQAKLASARLDDIVSLGRDLVSTPSSKMPDTQFFKRAFSSKTLKQLCRLREGLLAESRPTHESAILRAAALGCLHGPLVGGDSPSYFSNQMPRTFSSKPAYSLKFWREREMLPPDVDIMDVIKKKLARISDLSSDPFGRLSNVKCSDARIAASYRNIQDASLVITSPPYYGMRTYVQDQWLRMWFLGGSEDVDYSVDDQICHSGHDAFVTDLAKVWKNLSKHCQDGAHLYVRFGTLASAKSDAKVLMRRSIEECGEWKLLSVRSADTAHAGKRQADYMGQDSTAADEFDFHAILN